LQEPRGSFGLDLLDPEGVGFSAEGQAMEDHTYDPDGHPLNPGTKPGDDLVPDTQPVASAPTEEDIIVGYLLQEARQESCFLAPGLEEELRSVLRQATTPEHEYVVDVEVGGELIVQVIRATMLGDVEGGPTAREDGLTLYHPFDESSSDSTILARLKRTTEFGLFEKGYINDPNGVIDAYYYVVPGNDPRLAALICTRMTEFVGSLSRGNDSWKLVGIGAWVGLPGESTCFAGDVEVRTPAGAVPISELLPGALVSSWDRRIRCIATSEVVKVVRHGRTPVSLYSFGSGRVAATPWHTVLTAQGWRRLGKLGDSKLLVVEEGTGAPGRSPVDGAVRLPVPEEVFNLVTYPHPNFIVGDGIVAHNYTIARRVRTLLRRLLVLAGYSAKAPLSEAGLNLHGWGAALLGRLLMREGTG